MHVFSYTRSKYSMISSPRNGMKAFYNPVTDRRRRGGRQTTPTGNHPCRPSHLYVPRSPAPAQTLRQHQLQLRQRTALSSAACLPALARRSWKWLARGIVKQVTARPTTSSCATRAQTRVRRSRAKQTYQTNAGSRKLQPISKVA